MDRTVVEQVLPDQQDELSELRNDTLLSLDKRHSVITLMRRHLMF